jgi:hypothetical protein
MGDELPLNKSAHALAVALTTGIIRDGGSTVSILLKDMNASQALFNSATILGSNTFPYPKGSNTTINIFNLTFPVTANAGLGYLDQSMAVAGNMNGHFAVLYPDEFDQLYQIVAMASELANVHGACYCILSVRLHESPILSMR